MAQIVKFNFLFIFLNIVIMQNLVFSALQEPQPSVHPLISMLQMFV